MIYEQRFLSSWLDAVGDYKTWNRAAEINEYIANLLYKRRSAAVTKFTNVNESTPITLEEADDISMSRVIAMFYGLALEGYLKAYMVKFKEISPVVEELKDGKLRIARELTTHNLFDLFTKFRDPRVEEEKLLRDLTRAVKSGKYFFERYFNPSTYFYNLDKTVSRSKMLILEIKKLLK